MNKKDKIKGMLFGYALGNALGIGTELMTRQEIKIHYPEGLRSFSQIIRDGHRCQWEKGDWSNDTEMLLMLVDSLIESKGIDIIDYAHRLKKWHEEDPADLATVYRCVFPEPHWKQNPLMVARNAWHKNHFSDPSNEAIHRALISGIVSGEELLEDTRNLIQMTHNDSRCVCTAVIVARMVQLLYWEDSEPSFEELLSIADSIDHRAIPYIEIAKNGSLEELELDDEETVWYTRKTMSAALWALWHCDTPTEILHTLVAAGGDADTNAALGMALAGLKYGYEAMPEEVNNLIQYNRIDQQVERLNTFLESAR